MLGDTENFIHDIYCENVSQYWLYRDDCFATAVAKAKCKQ